MRLLTVGEDVVSDTVVRFVAVRRAIISLPEHDVVSNDIVRPVATIRLLEHWPTLRRRKLRRTLPLAIPSLVRLPIAPLVVPLSRSIARRQDPLLTFLLRLRGQSMKLPVNLCDFGSRPRAARLVGLQLQVHFASNVAL